MSKEQIAKELAKVVLHLDEVGEADVEEIILEKLTEILHADKGKLTEGTIV